jgi:hypothetical protein
MLHWQSSVCDPKGVSGKNLCRYVKPTQLLATDNDILPVGLSAAELRGEIIAQFQAASPEYRLLKVIPASEEARPRRRQTT